jgi:hypothetical protein
MKNPASMVRNKALYVDWDKLQSGYGDTLKLRALTERQYTLLLAMAEYASWRTRWQNAPLQPVLTDFTDELRYRLMADIEICMYFIDCIENDIDVRLALKAWLLSVLADDSDVKNEVTNIVNNYTNGNSSGLNTGGSQTPGSFDLGYGVNTECDKDILWSQCLGLIQFINRTIEDLLQKIEPLTNPVEIADVITDSPIITVLSAGTSEIVNLAADAIDYAVSTLTEGYLSEYDSALEIELACLLFCACQDDCVITVDRLFDTMALRAGQAIEEWTSLESFFSLLTGISIGTANVVPIAFFAWAGFLKIGSFVWYSAANFSLQYAITVSSDSPSNDWELLCECGSTWSKVFDLTGGSLPAGLTLLSEFGVHVPGSGVTQGANPYGILVFSTEGIDRVVTGISLSFTGIYAGTQAQFLQGAYTGDNVNLNFQDVVPPAGTHGFTGVPVTADTQTWRIGLGNAYGGFTAAYLTEITLSGEGSNPYA